MCPDIPAAPLDFRRSLSTCPSVPTPCPSRDSRETMYLAAIDAGPIAQLSSRPKRVRGLRVVPPVEELPSEDGVPLQVVPALRDRAGREGAADFEIVVPARQRCEAQRSDGRAGSKRPAFLRRLFVREQVHGFELGRLIPAVVEHAEAIAHQALERAPMRHHPHGPPGRQRVADARPVDEIEIPRPGQAFVAERHLELAALDLGEDAGRTLTNTSRQSVLSLFVNSAP